MPTDLIKFDVPEKRIPKMLIELDTLATASISVYELNESQITTICDLIDVRYCGPFAFRLDLFNYMNARGWQCVQIHFDGLGNVIALMNFNSDIDL